MSPGASTTGKGYSWRGAIRGNVLMMGVVSLFTDFSSEMIYPLLPVFFTGLVGAGAAALYVGLMEGIAEATASLLKIFSGRISDKLGKRKALVAIGYGISTAIRPLMALAGAGWHVIGLRFADRVGKGIRTAPRDALISDAVGPDARGLAFSFHRAMDHAGAVLGPIVGVAILFGFLGYGLWKGTGTKEAAVTSQEMLAMRWLFAIALIPGLAAMIALVTKVRDIAPKREEGKAGAAIERDQVAQLPKRFYAFVGIVTLFALGNSSDLFWILYAGDLFKWPLLQLIGVWVVMHVSKIIFSFPGGIISDKLGRRPVMLAGWIMYALVYLGMAFVSAQWQFWVLVFAYGFYYGMTEGAEKAVVADFIPSEHRGTAYGVYHAAVGIAALPASLVFGVLWYELNKVQEGLGPKVAFGIGAGLAGAAAVLLVLLLSRTREGVAGRASS